MTSSMPFYEVLKKRKSIRKFKAKPVSKKLIELLLGAAMEAPSGKNRQNWRFIVLQGKKRDEYLHYSQKSWNGIKDVLKERLKPSLYEFTERFFYTLGGAPVVVLCYSQNDTSEKYLTSVGSVYMAVENLNLAAVYEGLGVCTMGAPLEIKDELNLFIQPEKLTGEKNLELLCAVAIGWPDHDPPKAKRNLENRVSWLES
jgi:nitroreductase